LTGYSNLPLYYRTVFAMIHHHKYSLTEVENMYPYERDIFVEFIAEYMEELNSKRQG